MADYKPPAIFGALPRRFAPLPPPELKTQPAHSAEELRLVRHYPSGAAAFPGTVSPGEVAERLRAARQKGASIDASTHRTKQAVRPRPLSVKAQRRAEQDEVLLRRMRAEPDREWSALDLVAGTHIFSRNVRQFADRQTALVEKVWTASGKSWRLRLRQGIGGQSA